MVTVTEAINLDKRVRVAYDNAADVCNHIGHIIKELDDFQRILVLHEIASYCDRFEIEIRNIHVDKGK